MLKHVAITVALIAVCAMPMKLGVSPLYSLIVMHGAQALVIAAGPAQHHVDQGGQHFEIDRHEFLREYFRDQEVAPSGYNLLVIWIWIAAASNLPWQRRARLAILGSGVVGTVEILSLAFSAATWYRESAAYSLSISVEYLGGTAVVSGLATSCANLSLLVIPAIFAVIAFPGFTTLGLHD